MTTRLEVNSNNTIKWMAVIVLVVIIIAGAALYYINQNSRGFGNFSAKTITNQHANDKTWSYYHDKNFDTSSANQFWMTNKWNESDPNEASFGFTNRWVYEGPYNYGEGTINGPKTGIHRLPDVYGDEYVTGEPIGQAPSSWSSPYYDPYAGYSNPYANRIRMAYGENGTGPGADAIDFGK